ncbi:MAG TPA: carbohydrate-binding family 9-like protein [Polyangiaceae bacterium]|nr:carbohydrate-binding family 9-like protein [Polyangiaceae bacterium]
MHRSSLLLARARAAALVAVLASGAVSCVGGSKGLSTEEKDRLKPYVIDSVPPDVRKIDVNFENKVHLVGYKFEPETAKPGEEVRLTYYWRCDDTLDSGWLLFTHTKDEGSGKLGNLDFDGPIREQKNGDQILGPDHWERGKIYVDTQTYRIPGDVSGPDVSILVGIWKGDARLRIVSGPNDGENCAIVGKVRAEGVTPKAASEHSAGTEVPSLLVPRLAEGAKITIDGKASEKEWQTAASTGAFVDVGTGKPNSTFPVNGSAKLTWDDKNLYVLCEVKEKEPYVGFTDAKSQPNDFTAAGQPKLWLKDTMEMMVDPGPSGDNRDYYELQINPQNKVFKSQFDTLQQPKGGPNGPFGHEDWDPKLKSAVQLEKGPDGKVSGYTVEVAIPWAGYTKAANHPPKPGDVWRINFYAMKENGGVAWSPILGEGNFHKATRFGRVTWTVPGASVPGAENGVASLAAAQGDAGTRSAPLLRGPLHAHLPPQPPASASP